jgi:RHH-type transcriptional regulator, rel operon repressor / antitoxin RelB
MSQITARLPDKLVQSLDNVVKESGRPRSELVRRAIEIYIDDYKDLSLAIDRLRDPADPVLDWEDVKCELFNKD